MAQVSRTPRSGREADPAPVRMGGQQVFAAVMMVVLGVLHALTGIAAISRGIIPTTPSLTYTLPPVVWGWTQIVFGVLLAAAGAAVLQGRLGGRLVGIGVAALSLFVNFLFLLLHPAWAVVLMAVDVLIIRALTVGWPERDRRERDSVA
jgi:lysylphosphatidylglycerol synthetase-like protein (DUF2156 family)